jgi:hypothetical protein
MGNAKSSKRSQCDGQRSGGVPKREENTERQERQMMAARRGLRSNATYLEIVEHDMHAARVAAANASLYAVLTEAGPPQQPPGGRASASLAAARLPISEVEEVAEITGRHTGQQAPRENEAAVAATGVSMRGITEPPAGVDPLVWAELPQELHAELLAEARPRAQPEPEPEPMLRAAAGLEPEPEPPVMEGIPPSHQRPAQVAAGARLQRTLSGSFRAAEAQLQRVLARLPQPANHSESAGTVM